MTRTTVCLVVLALVPVLSASPGDQPWQIVFTVPQAAYVLAEPIEARLTARNVAQQGLAWLGFRGDFFLDGSKAACRPWDTPYSTPPKPPPGGVTPSPVTAPNLEPPGTNHTLDRIDIFHLCFDHQNRQVLGNHELCYHKPESTEGQTCVSFTVVPPTSVDREAYEFFKGQPLAMVNWGELLQKFPTSIYAGHALTHRGPSQALWSFTSLNDPDGELRKYSDFGAGEETTRQTIAKARAEMQAYAEAAGLFLGAHPDFLHASFIRRMYAMCLGLTGRMPEALAEIRTLSTGTGKEAAEAKAFLAESASTKPRN